MDFKRRTNYDINVCEFEGRIAVDPELIEYERADKTITDRVNLRILCNSNQFSSRSIYPFDCYAFGNMAQRIKATLFKGCKVFVIAEYRPTIVKASKKKGIERHEIPAFQIRHIVLEAYPPDKDELPDKDRTIEEDFE